MKIDQILNEARNCGVSGLFKVGEDINPELVTAWEGFLVEVGDAEGLEIDDETLSGVAPSAEEFPNLVADALSTCSLANKVRMIRNYKLLYEANDDGVGLHDDHGTGGDFVIIYTETGLADLTVERTDGRFVTERLQPGWGIALLTTAQHAVSPPVDGGRSGVAVVLEETD